MCSASMGLLCDTLIRKYAVLLSTARRKGFVDLVFEKAGRRRCRHELTVHLGRNSAILDQLAVAELDLQKLRLGVVTGSADLVRVDAFSFHGHSSDRALPSPERTEATCP